MLHKLMPVEHRHALHSFEFPTQVEREAYVFTADDVGKTIRQLDNNTFYLITAVAAGVATMLQNRGDTGVAAYVQLTADVSIGGHRVMIVTATGCNYADKDDLSHVDKVIGLTQSAFNSGSAVEVFTAGEIMEISWGGGLVVLTTDGLPPSATNQLVIPATSACTFTGKLTAYSPVASPCASVFHGLISNTTAGLVLDSFSETVISEPIGYGLAAGVDVINGALKLSYESPEMDYGVTCVVEYVMYVD